jgi:hypothetical protein
MSLGKVTCGQPVGSDTGPLLMAVGGSSKIESIIRKCVMGRCQQGTGPVACSSGLSECRDAASFGERLPTVHRCLVLNTAVVPWGQCDPSPL